jgi:hypothetical protein
MVVKDCNFVTMKQLLLLFLLTSPLLYWAQDITVFGHCYLKGKKPAVGAKVQLMVRDNRSVNIPAETTTNQEGYYAFENIQVGQILEIQYFFEVIKHPHNRQQNATRVTRSKFRHPRQPRRSGTPRRAKPI